MEWYVLLSLVIAFFGILVAKSGKNNVCKTFDDYYSNRDNNLNCYYNPDYSLTVPQIIQRHGYPVEQYHTTTTDGYILTLFRIPHGLKENSASPTPVFIQHGVAINSAVFVNVGPRSLAFILADAGYDVWLGNFRGSVYSGSHEQLDNTTSEYWDFSFHEHGYYDLPAQINLVYMITQTPMYYLGFSMGSTASFVYSSTFPKTSKQKVKMFINMAPIVYLDSVGFFNFFSYVWFILEASIRQFSNGKLFLWPILPEVIAKYLCFPFPFQMKMCQILDMMAFGFNYAHNNPETLPITLKQNMDATSLKVVTHYVQVIHTGNFDYFDYGIAENKKRYGTTTPPRYNLSRIQVPHYLISGANDKLGNTQSIERLHKNLPKRATPYAIYEVPDEEFTHLSFLSAINASEVVYSHIVDLLDAH